MIYYGIGESIEPLVSKNFGARHTQNISAYISTALLSTLVVALFICGTLLLSTELLINIFLKPEETAIIEIAIRFVSYFWPAFVFSGINICLTAYFTACHKPLQSASIALSRSLLRHPEAGRDGGELFAALHACRSHVRGGVHRGASLSGTDSVPQ